MKILLHDHAGHPYSLALAKGLSQHDNMQINYCYRGDDITPHGDILNAESHNLLVTPLFTKAPLNKYNIFSRYFQEKWYGKVLVENVISFKPDLVISVSAPLYVQKSILRHCQDANIRFVHWWADITSLTAREILKEKYGLFGIIVSQLLIRVEKYLVKNASQVIISTINHKSLCKKWGANQDNIVLFPFWAPIQDFPKRKKNNEWSITHDLDHTFNFIWTGTIGFKHNPQLLIDLAYHFKFHQEVKIVIVSESIGAKWIRKKAIEEGLTNIVVLDFQPYDQVPNVMATADVLVANVKDSLSFYAVPSKVLSYLCSQRPILIAIKRDNLIAHIINQSNAGITVNEQERIDFIEAADKLYRSEKMRKDMGKSGRNYAERHFVSEFINQEFKDKIIFNDL
jgi:colanic acid biosynthesis glycosyl transferase WcaI